MTNANFPRGFQFYNDKGVDTVLIEANIDSTNATSIGSGDTIIQEADGNVARASAGAPDGLKQLGVANSFRDSTGSFLQLIPANTAGTVSFVPLLEIDF